MDLAHAVVGAIAGMFAGTALDTRSANTASPEASPAEHLARFADAPAVQQAAESLGGRERQVTRLQEQLAAARARVAEIESGALVAEEQGAPVASLLADARQAVQAAADMLALAQRARDDAEKAHRRAIEDARASVKAAHMTRVVAQLDELELLLWRVREQQAAIHDSMMDAVRDGVPLVPEARYWDVGFPGFHALRQDEDIMCWLRNRSLAPRQSRHRDGARP